VGTLSQKQPYSRLNGDALRYLTAKATCVAFIVCISISLVL
jgi:hypothetical protein